MKHNFSAALLNRIELMKIVHERGIDMTTNTAREFQTIGVLATLCAVLASPHASAAPATTLAAAKTIQVQETFLAPDAQQKLVPRYQMAVRVTKPNKIRIDMVRANPGPDAPKHASYFVTDGKSAHEYNGPANEFVVSDIPPAGQSFQSQAYSMASVDALLKPNEKPSPHSGVKRTASVETVGGRKLNVFTDTYPSGKGGDGASYTIIQKKWVDPNTGLPFRMAVSVKQGAKTTVLQQTNFTGWTLDKPIPAAQFAWAPPSGAKEHTEPKLLATGTAAPDFTAITPDGKEVKLSDYKGKVVVVDFWATWCGPCQSAMPHLEKVYQQVKDKDVAVLGVCVWDDKKAYDKWVTEKKGVYNFPTAFDPAGQSSEKSIAGSLYHVTGIPTQYVIDKDGKVAATTVGYDENDHVLEKALVKLGVDIPAEPKSASAK